ERGLFMVLFDTGTVRIKYGAAFEFLDLQTVDLRSIISPNGKDPIDDIPAAVTQALDEPIDHSRPLSARIKPGETALIIVTSYYERWYRPHLLLPPLLDYLNKLGVPDKNIAILVANGAMRPRSDQHRCIVGDNVQSR